MLPPVIIIHYHLRPGGVTKVVETQVDALQASGVDYHILTGEAYDGERGLRQTVIPDLDYKETSPFVKSDGKVLYEECMEAVKARFGEREVTWLIHNPTLGKNVLFPILITKLAEKQQKVILQCHDFAEDGRPSNFMTTSDSETIYPIAPNIHYALINSRDQEFLIHAGIPSEQTHLLPNAVSTSYTQGSPRRHARNLIVYPVRGIRRKNIGELLLWSVLAPEGNEFVLTKAPVNEKWLPYYEIWEALAKELELPVILDCVDKRTAPGTSGKSFKHWMEAATHCITTSVAEGFGLTFLEPKAQNTPLIGRDIPEITRDFKKELSLGNLYQKLLVPLSALDAEELKKEFKDGLESAALSYQQPCYEVEYAWLNLTKGEMVDFGNLPEHHQLALIYKAHREGFDEFYVVTESGDHVHAYTWIKQSLTKNQPTTDSLKSYSPQAYEDRLVKLLLTLSQSSPTPPTWLDKENVLKEFLKPEHFHFLRT